ncbi:unnamed protein product [Spirodela intermedia]|uniref:Transcription repressor n=1 Tax=Spirodela intermedia TaxID=51605 RepID=A0A7I8ISS1_SPIIN|nr:unnamed protein product [Spirodela intermedia]CAA6660619.1 unnamed protein product [Spirodela intermedia]
MSSSGKKFLMRHPVVVDLGCGCRRGKLSSLFSAQPKPRTKTKEKPYSAPKEQQQHHHHYRHPLSSHNPSSISTTTASLYDDDASSPSSYANWGRKQKQKPEPAAATAAKKPAGGKRRGKGRVGESVAVVKESEDPYVDFRDSMLQMILEKEIFAWEDLQDLLNRFLALNAPCHHDVIVRAFSEIWNGVFSYVSAPPPPPSGGAAAAPYRKHGRPRGGPRRRPPTRV